MFEQSTRIDARVRVQDSIEIQENDHRKPFTSGARRAPGGYAAGLPPIPSVSALEQIS